jgi:hypothetical protein
MNTKVFPFPSLSVTSIDWKFVYIATLNLHTRRTLNVKRRSRCVNLTVVSVRHVKFHLMQPIQAYTGSASDCRSEGVVYGRRRWRSKFFFGVHIYLLHVDRCLFSKFLEIGGGGKMGWVGGTERRKKRKANYDEGCRLT